MDVKKFVLKEISKEKLRHLNRKKFNFSQTLLLPFIYRSAEEKMEIKLLHFYEFQTEMKNE